MVGPDRYPAGVVQNVVDAIRDRLAEVLVWEVVDIDPFGLPGGLVLPATVLEVSDQFLLLGVNGDHRLAISRMLGDLPRQVAELGIAVLMLTTLSHLRIRLQTETQVTQHLGDRTVRHPMTRLGQRRSQVPRRLRRPHQQRHRIPPGLRIHQRLQLR